MTSVSTQRLTHVHRDDDREPEVRPLNLKLIVRLMEYTRPYARKRNWLFFVVVMRSIQLPVITWLMAHIIRGPIAEGDWPRAVLETVAYGVMVVVAVWMLSYRQRLALELGEQVVHDLRAQMFAHLQKMPMSYFHQTRLGRIISRMTSDIEAVRIGVQEVIFVSIVSLGQMTVSAALMLWIDPVLFSIVLLLGPILWLINQAFARQFSKVHRAVQESFSRVTATLAESVSGIRVTQGFVRHEVNAEMFADLVADHAQYNVAVARTNAMFTPLLEFNAQFFMAALLLVGGYRVLSPEIGADVGSLIMFFFLANLFFQPLSNLGTEYANALSAMAGAERVFQFLDTPPQWQDPPPPQVIEPRPIRGHVEFRNVSFEYVPGRPVLHDINFAAEPGQTIALVGSTGSGKSSIINLISKFYLPTKGSLTIDGHDIRMISGDCLHQQMGIVLQVNFLFTDTVLNNIKVGKPGATDEEVIEAARKIDVLDLLEALPEGLNTHAGDRGQSLSLGQRQVVCFTRAMLADPPILILDEATSSVDTITEFRIQRALSLLLQNRTSFVVAHRLSTIRHADLVLVLDRGRIVERGTHVELLSAGGIYANMYRQFVRAGEA